MIGWLVIIVFVFLISKNFLICIFFFLNEVFFLYTSCVFRLHPSTLLYEIGLLIKKIKRVYLIGVSLR
jgi:hypothetical protein